MLLAVLRHGDTQWSTEGRIQGRSDVPLSDAGRVELLVRRLPVACEGMTCISSPLRRCVETAQCLGVGPQRHEPRLIEMSWGTWEGRTLAALREELGAPMAENEA